MRWGANDEGPRRLRLTPLLAAADGRTLRRLAGHAEWIRLHRGDHLIDVDGAVRWVAFPVAGSVHAHGAPRRRSWVIGDAVYLAEALLHAIAPQTVVAGDDGASVVSIPLRALTAAITTDALLGAAVAHYLAREVMDVDVRPWARTRRGFEPRRRDAAIVSPAA